LLAAVGGAFTLLTWWQGRQSKAFEREAENVRNAAQQRLGVWREASPLLNDIYVYYMYIGRFNEETRAS